MRFLTAPLVGYLQGKGIKEMSKNVKNVLSIDMDYIMAPCINLYNDCVGGDEFANMPFWAKVNEIRGVDKYLEYDPNKLLFVVDVLTNALKNVEPDKILFAAEHDMILELLCRDDNPYERFNVYNIDHHHDIYYNPTQKSEIDRFDYACLANWVYYLGKNEKIIKYFWVRNENSMPFPNGEISELTFPFDDEELFEHREKIFDVKFDYIFCCQSHEYFPDKFAYLFDMLRILTENVKGKEMKVWNTPYCVDGKSRPVAK